MMAGWKAKLRRRAFLTHWSGIFVFPSHILRSGLVREIGSLAPRISGDVLDFGCGSKPYEDLFAHCSDYVGIDIEDSAHDHRSSKVDRFYDGATIPFDDARFDNAVAFEVFEHVPDLDLALAELHRVVKPGGYLLFSIPFAFGEHEMPHDYRRLTSTGLQAALRSNGFAPLEMRRTSSNFLTASQLAIDAIADARALGNWWKLARIPLVALMNVMALSLNAFVPKRHDLPLGFVILAQHNGTAGGGELSSEEFRHG